MKQLMACLICILCLGSHFNNGTPTMALDAFK